MRANKPTQDGGGIAAQILLAAEARKQTIE
jgi:hypothetical protein